MRRRSRGSLMARVLALGLATAVVAWAAGFVWFVVAAMRPRPVAPRSDGVVALTGGPDRVRAALQLLADGRAGKLLVTGIGGGANFRALAERAGVDPAPLASRVTLGRGATSTRGNAAETAAWVQANGFRSVIVVTAFYHMPRALAELGRAVPGVQLHPAPVSSHAMRAAAGLDSLSGLRVMSEEYMKFLGAELGISALEAGPGPSLSSAAEGRTQG